MPRQNDAHLRCSIYLYPSKELEIARREKDEKELERQSGDKRGGFELESKKPEQEEFMREGFEEALRRANHKTSSQPKSESDET